MASKTSWVPLRFAVTCALCAIVAGCGSGDSGTGRGGTPGAGGSADNAGVGGSGASAGASSGGTGDSGVFRPFTADSYWNKPMPANAPTDPNSALYIADAQDAAKSDPYLGLTGAPGANQAYAAPLVWSAKTDPSYTIKPAQYRPTVTVRVPLGATPQAGTDGSLWIFDLPDNELVEFWQASFDATTGWSDASNTRYMIDSNGLNKRVAGSNQPLNDGHRGEPPSVQLVRLDEVKAGAIEHRLECNWHATGQPNASTPWFYWPMVGYEQNKGGIVPEGIVIRIKPSVDLSGEGLSPAALIIATALQKYGCMIGDNSGGTHNNVKLELNEAAWKALDPALGGDSLKNLPWSDWEFVRGGYDPPAP